MKVAVLAIAAVLALGVTGAIYVLTHGQPKPLGLAQVTPRTPAPSPAGDDPQGCPHPAGLAGVWTIQPGSVAGYRAHEKFAELTSPHEAVARTAQVTGWVQVRGGGPITVEAGCVAVDVSTLQSVDELPGFNTADRDKSAREFLNARRFPFVIFQPRRSAYPLDPSSRAVQRVALAGDLQITGISRPVTFDLDLRLQGGQLAAAGRTSVLVTDFGVDVPQEAGGFVQVDPHITLEVSLIVLGP